MTDELFQTTIKEMKRNTWEFFKEVVSKFLGNRKNPFCKSIVGETLKNFQKLGC